MKLILLIVVQILLVVQDKMPQQDLRALESKIHSLPDVLQARFVTKEDGLLLLKNKDPELAKSIVLFGDNPIPEFFEVKIDDNAIGNIDAWLDSNVYKAGLKGISGVLYKAEEAYAILQVNFYRSFIRLSLALAALSLVLFSFFVELSAVKKMPVMPSVRHASGWIFSGILGGATASLLCWMLVFPMKYLSPMLWSYSSLKWQCALLLAGALLGRTLFRWKESQ